MAGKPGVRLGGVHGVALAGEARRASPTCFAQHAVLGPALLALCVGMSCAGRSRAFHVLRPAPLCRGSNAARQPRQRRMSLQCSGAAAAPAITELTVATWNVNSIRQRLPNVLRYLEERRPDVLALQETKCQDHAFPLAELRALGYEAAVAGQKSYNGVAIFSRHPMHNVRIGLAGGEGDSMEPQARYIEADVCGVKICNVYVVNGNPVPSAAFSYRERFLGRLIVHVSRLAALAQPFVLMGDFNCVQHDDQCYDADRMREDAVMHASSRHQFRALCYAAGLYNAQDLHAARSSPALHAQDLLGAGRDLSRCYTYWDYRGGCWPKDLGLRIDHILLHPQVADRLDEAGVDRWTRGWATPSDHAPVWARFGLAQADHHILT